MIIASLAPNGPVAVIYGTINFLHLRIHIHLHFGKRCK